MQNYREDYEISFNGNAMINEGYGKEIMKNNKTSDKVGDYSSHITDALDKCSVLTREQEVELAKRIELGDAEAKKRLIEANIGLLSFVVDKYFKVGPADREDYAINGYDGLCKAVDRFDYRKGTKFSTTAVAWIRKEIQGYQQKNAAAIVRPQNQSEDSQKLNRFVAEFENKNYCEPNDDDIMKSLGWTKKRLFAAREASREVYSLDYPMGDNGDDEDEKRSVFGDFVPDTRAEMEFEKAERDEIVRSFFEERSKRELIIAGAVANYCGRKNCYSKPGKGYAFVAKQLGISEKEVKECFERVKAAAKKTDLARYRGCYDSETYNYAA